MNEAFDLSSVRMTLRSMVAKGLLTPENLDTPSPSWAENAREFAKHYPLHKQPVYRNLLREEEPPQERVSFEPDPRDFEPEIEF
jgi:hypothetical protein